jgi:putative transposase
MLTRISRVASDTCWWTPWLGLPLLVYVTLADDHDRVGARWLLAGLGLVVLHLKKLWADGAYGGEEFASWCEE